jgi:hypothetical protein
MTPSGIEPATFRLVAQCLTATAAPYIYIYIGEFTKDLGWRTGWFDSNILCIFIFWVFVLLKHTSQECLKSFHGKFPLFLFQHTFRFIYCNSRQCNAYNNKNKKDNRASEQPKDKFLRTSHVFLCRYIDILRLVVNPTGRNENTQLKKLSNVS